MHHSGSDRRQRILSTGSQSSGRRGNGRQCDHYRVVMLGAGGVGKTAIISRFLYDSFPLQHQPTVDEIHHASYKLSGIDVTLDVLDTSGTLQFPAMRRLAISTGDAFLLVFGLDDAASFEEVRRLREMINDSFLQRQKSTSGAHNDVSSGDRVTAPPIVVVGNKSDKERRVAPIETMASIVNVDWSCGYVETSAEKKKGMNDIFRELLLQSKGKLKFTRTTQKRSESASSSPSHQINGIDNKNDCKLS